MQLNPVSIAAALGLAATTVSAAEPHALIAAGADFCLSRDYDAAHKKTHPHQLITAICIMGRNAWHAGGEEVGFLAATMRVTFRDRTRPLDLYGRCLDVEGGLKCTFVPADFADVLAEVIHLREKGGRIEATASSDWRVIRAGREPDGAYGPPTTDDTTFLLDRKPLSACTPLERDWGPEGPSAALMDRLP